jgi:guanosine-3',5'-bis(diphosphate) 3'-pyrophosphohydrolase
MSSRLDRLADTPPPFIRESAMLRAAYELARCAHRGQERKDPGSPFVVHPILVAERLHAYGYREQVLAAALLHDVVERSELTAGDVGKRFGVTVANLVSSLTDDPSAEGFVAAKTAQRDEVARANREVKAIFAADRASNARELTRLILTYGESVTARDKALPQTRVRVWSEDVEMLEQQCPDLDLLPEMRLAVDDFAAAVAQMRGGQPALA